MSTQVKAIAAISATSPMQEFEITRRDLQPHDIAFEIVYCGICHSDLHSIRNDWGGTQYPLVPGHEVVGRVVSVGSEVKGYATGDWVAVGCIVGSCQHCEYCTEGHEQFCTEGTVMTYNSPDHYLGGVTYGGFSKLMVTEDRYVLRMPPFADMSSAAPLLCAGITVYSPLKHWGAAPGKRVGIVGIGGLGHVAIRIAKAMGAEVTVFTTSPSKVEDAQRLGADHAILSTDRDQLRQCPKQDIIIDTVSAPHDVNAFLFRLKVDGAMILVGLPEKPIEIASFALVKGRKSLSGSNIGGIAETQEMLDFCYKHNITADCELITPSQINEALDRLHRGDVKYRFVIDIEQL